VILSFFSKNFVSTKWRIYKGILASPRLLRQGISRGCRECELIFSTKFLKTIISGLEVEKKILKEKKPIPVVFVRKAIVLNRIYTEIVVWKYIFNVVVQAKTKHERSRQTQTQLQLVCSKNISAVLYKYKWSLVIFLNCHNYFFIFFSVAWAWGNAFETIVFNDC
jgi:hypothetical protein